MSTEIKYYGTERVHGHDSQPLSGDTFINVRFKGLTGETRVRAGHIGHLHQEPQDSYPVSYTIPE